MSGHKHATITISQEEYRRLHEIDMERRFKKKKAPKDSDSRYNALLEAYQLIEERQKDYESLIAEMNEEMAVFEAEQSSDILAVQSEYYQNLINQLQDLQEENSGAHHALRETTQYFEEVIQNEKAKAQERYNTLLQQVSLMGQEQNLKEEHAREWIESCKQLSIFINDKYDHNKFYPSAYGKIVQRLNMAIQNLNRGFVDSGLQFAQEAYLQYSELRVALEQKTSEWQASYQIASDEVRELFERVSSTPVIPAIGVNGEDLHIDINLDYWSKGKYSNLYGRLETMLSMVQNSKDEINFDDLDKLTNEIIPMYRQFFSDIVFEARQNLVNSQIKYNVACLAMEALEKHGFSLKQAEYKNNDKRDAFFAQLSDPSGSKIILQITPNKINHTNTLAIDTLDDTVHTEDEYMRRWNEINHSLVEAGVQVGQVQVSDAGENVEVESSPVIERRESPLTRQQNIHYVQSNRASTSTYHK